MERGNLFYYQEDYKRASEVFIEANELVDRLYTKSIREKLASSVLNDTKETFFGSVYERSLLYYYQAMSFYQLYLKGQYKRQIKQDDGKTIEEVVTLTQAERNRLRDQTRNTLIAWDSFFVDIKRTKGVKTFLKDDLVSKSIAAKLHYHLGTRRDKEIALQLFKDAREILIKVGPTYKSFNKDFKQYNLELRQLYDGEIKAKQVKSKDLTQTYQETINYFDYWILKVTQEIRKFKMAQTKQLLKPSQEVLGRIKKDTQKNKPSVLIEVGHISQLQGKDFSLNLRSALENVENPASRALIEGIGIPILTYFAMGPLGLGYLSHHGNVSIYTNHNVGTTMVKEVGVEFELPFAAESKKTGDFYIIAYQGEKKVFENKAKLLSSLSDLAYIHSQELIANNFSKRSIRVGVKYALAILAAYQTYKKVQESGGELFAKPAALAQFLVSSKAIKESEKADARHWSLLPASLMSLELDLAPGEYRLEFAEYNAQDKTIKSKRDLGKIVIKPKEASLFSYRVF